MGLDESSSLIVVVHTFDHLDVRSARVRIISARKANKRERETYEEGI
ncbi:MAG: hypothetical protein ABI539_11310 [Acidobacteriota bacterium]